MFAVRNLTRAMPQAKAAIAGRGMSTVVSGPPRNKVSFMEFVGHSTLMIACWFAVPTWVLVNIRAYRGQA